MGAHDRVLGHPERCLGLPDRWWGCLPGAEELSACLASWALNVLCPVLLDGGSALGRGGNSSRIG